jgi:hypothetical protein
LEQIQQLDKVVEPIESTYNELAEFQTTMSEKRAQLERLRVFILELMLRELSNLHQLFRRWRRKYDARKLKSMAIEPRLKKCSPAANRATQPQRHSQPFIGLTLWLKKSR